MFLLLRFAAYVLAISLMLPGVVMAAEVFPNKTIRILATEAGAASDVAARMIAQAVAGPLAQTVIVENRGGLRAVEAVAQAQPDGYTLLFYSTALWIGPLLQKMSYDPVKDFAPVTLVSTSPVVLVVHPSLAANSVKELIALAKSRPGGLNYGSGGTGSTPHLATELFKSMAGVNIVRVPYKGVAGALTALLVSEVQMLFASAGSVTPYIKSGKLKALGVASVRPSALAPDLPTIAATVPGYEATPMSGIFAPAKTPATIIQKLNQEIVRAINTDETKDKFFRTGSEVVGSSPEQFAARIKTEMVSIGKVIKDTGMRTE